MSATNWDTCPQCLARAMNAHEAEQKAINDSYGKVPVEEFDKRRDALGQSPQEEGIDDTLREDYEIGVAPQGEFYVIYKCSCTVCGFGHKFKHEDHLTMVNEKETSDAE